MLAAEFHYNDDYIDWHLDMDDLFSHMRYRDDHPHPGALLMAMFGDKEEKKKEPIEKKSKSQTSNYIEDFIADWTGSGGTQR